MNNGELVLNQEFQYFTGTFNSGNKIYDVTEGKLKGDSVSFVINGTLYEGLASENAMTGTYLNKDKGKKTDWAARR